MRQQHKMYLEDEVVYQRRKGLFVGLAIGAVASFVICVLIGLYL
jgi:hypothetical protein